MNVVPGLDGGGKARGGRRVLRRPAETAPGRQNFFPDQYGQAQG